MSDSLNAFPQHPLCGFCKDGGIVHLPEFPPCYRFCACAAGVARAASDPTVIDEANAREAALVMKGRV